MDMFGNMFGGPPRGGQQQQGQQQNMFGGGMFGGGMFGGPPQPQQGGMFGGGMFGGPPPQQQQQQQQQQQGGFGGGMFGGGMFGAPPPQHQQGGFGGPFGADPFAAMGAAMGGAMGAMGAMTGGMFGGGAAGVDPFASLFTDRNEHAAPPEVVPSTALQFRCNTKTVMSMMPGMVVGGVMHYDFPRLRQRQEWGHEFGQIGWEVERWDLRFKVRRERPDEAPEVTELKADETMTTYGIVPFAVFEGTECVGGVLCYRYSFDFFGIMQLRTWSLVPADVAAGPGAGDDSHGAAKQVSVPVFADVSMMGGINIKIHFTDHNVDCEMPDALFAIEQYCPPRGPPTVVAGYVKDATTNRTIPGAQVEFTPRNGAARTAAMSAAANSSGSFSATIPAAEYDVVYSAPGFASLRRPLNVTGSIAAGTFADACLSPVLEGAQVRFVLRWGASPRDLDLHAISASGAPICSYRNRVHALASLNVDVRCGFGPETITVPDRGALDGIVIMVHQFTGDGAIAGCGAVVDMYDNTGHCGQVAVPLAGPAGGRWWRVARIANGAIQIINELC